MPLNIKAWMQSMKESILLRERQYKYHPDSNFEQWKSYTLSRAKEVILDTPYWEQDDSYNRKCPVKYGRHCYTGCAVTATAIVIGYHQWPDKGNGTLPKYTSKTNEFILGPITLGEAYNWKNMPKINGNIMDTNNAEQADAISPLMFHLGVMARADYSTTGTTAFLEAYYKCLVEIKQPVKPGYRLRLVYRANGSDVTKPITCDASIGEWEIILMEGKPEKEQPLDQSTSIEYDVKSGHIVIGTLPGAKVSLKEKATATDHSTALKQNGNTFIIDSQLLGRGTYLLLLEKGSEKRK